MVLRINAWPLPAVGHDHGRILSTSSLSFLIWKRGDKNKAVEEERG